MYRMVALVERGEKSNVSEIAAEIGFLVFQLGIR